MSNAVLMAESPPPFRDPDNQDQAEIDDITLFVLELN